MLKLFSVVSYLHLKKIVHRDLKLENLLLTDKAADADIKLIDFGLSKKCKISEELHSKVGTPIYVSPEVIDGK